jgi:hypothetical protein
VPPRMLNHLAEPKLGGDDETRTRDLCRDSTDGTISHRDGAGGDQTTLSLRKDTQKVAHLRKFCVFAPVKGAALARHTPKSPLNASERVLTAFLSSSAPSHQPEGALVALAASYFVCDSP